MFRNTTPTQLLARMDHPEWNTTEGRVLDEVRATFVALSEGKTPQTVLGGLMLNGRFDIPSTKDGRSIGEIAAKVHISPLETNHRGDKIRDVLDDLIEIGWVEAEEPLPSTIEALLITKPGDFYDPIIHYRFSSLVEESAID